MFLSNLQELMSNLSGRIPNSVEWEIEELLEQYQDNITSILGQFPALQVCTVGVGVGLHCGGGAALWRLGCTVSV